MSIKISLLLVTLLIIGRNFEEVQDVSINNTSAPLDIYNQVNWKEVITDEETANAIVEKLQKSNNPVVVTMTTTTIKHRKSLKAVSYFNTIINGHVEDFQSISFKQIEHSLKSLITVGLPLQKVLIIWEIFKKGRNVEDLMRKDWEAIGNLILKIPENDLYQVNVSNSDIVDYLGTLPILTNRKAMILAYGIKCKFPKVFTVAKDLNRIKGLLCGFSSRDLRKIPIYTLVKIEPVVFNNLWACTEQQILVLLELCMSTYFYGYIDTWDEDTLEHLGFLVLALTPDQIKTISPEMTFFLSETVMNRMNDEQIKAFTEDQVFNLNDAARTVYNHKFIIENSSTKTSYFLNIGFICLLHYLL